MVRQEEAKTTARERLDAGQRKTRQEVTAKEIRRDILGIIIKDLRR